MIYCVKFSDVVLHLESLGFVQIGEAQSFVAFERAGPDRFTIRPPNVNGAIPESIVDTAYDAAGLDPPDWDVFWCD